MTHGFKLWRMVLITLFLTEPVASQETSPESNMRPVAALTDPRDGYPDISPDGSKIAFASNRGSTGKYHIYTMSLDGQDLQQITHAEGDYSYTQPAWAPDGSRIAAFRWIEDEIAEIGHIVVLDIQ